MVEAASPAVTILVRVNGEVTGGIEVSSGGFLALGSPSPTAGITEIALVHTTAVNVRIWALG
jgi:hypothetical protein